MTAKSDAISTFQLTRDRSLPSSAVNGARLWDRHMDMAKIGATKRGGVNRIALTEEDAQARALLVKWAEHRNFECSIDDIGNIFVRKSGFDSEAPPILTGSHLDTQPTGGKFDGVYGVLAGLEALEALADRGAMTRRSIEVAVWTDEEGCRFDQGCVGSQVFAQPSKLTKMLALRDAGGTSVAEALAELRRVLPKLQSRTLGFPVDSYIEAHIEQGPILEAEKKTIGIVTGMQGIRHFSVEVTGEEAHAGTTPSSSRRDALFAATDMITALRKIMRDPSDIVRFTVGRFVVAPNSPSVVPGRVTFSIDLRHPEHETLIQLGDQVGPICNGQSGCCSVSVTEVRRSEPMKFDGLVTREIEAVARSLEIACMRIPSGAGHDARFLATVCDAGMLFVPCERGVSHNERESAAPEDLAAGTRVLTDVLARLANR